MNTSIKSYRDLKVWQKAVNLCEEIYRLTTLFPKSELYGLTSQIRRCSVGIPSNIAEGFMRGHKTEYIQFLRIAYGSGAELETQLLIASRIGFIKAEDYKKLNDSLTEIMKMLNTLIDRLVQPKI
jgi:four helix bundle protein